MKERPILFNQEMVEAILEGRKTQTRRVLRVQPPVNDKTIMPLYQMEPEPKVAVVTFHKIIDDMPFPPSISRHKCPYGKIGDHLWVRETFCYAWNEDEHISDKDGNPVWNSKDAHVYYRATDNNVEGKWIPSIHMPRHASRISLEITNIRVERLNDISKQDVKAEGGPIAHPSIDKVSKSCGFENWPQSWFAQNWDWIYGETEYKWDQNPWVWVIEFKVIQGGAL